MKNSILKSSFLCGFSVLVFQINSASASGKIGWVQTPFWTAPQATEIRPLLKVISKGLDKNCQSYKKSVLNENGSLRFPVDAAYLERVRKAETQDISTSVFEARFALSSYDLELDLSAKITIDETKEKLPFYTQLKATTMTNPDEYKEIKIVAGPDSLTESSRSLGLDDSEVSVEFINYSPVLLIKGRDVACDLISGKARIEVKATSQISISDEGFSNLMGLYMNKIQKDLNEILVESSKDSPFFKAARIGYRLGGHLTEKNNNHPEVVEKQIEEMMKVFFTPNTLNNSANLVDMDGGKSKLVKIMSSVDGQPVNLKLEFQK